MKRFLYNVRTHLDIVICATGMLVILFICLMSEYNISARQNFPSLKDNITQIESLIGDYSEYYVIADKLNNPMLLHSVGGTAINDNTEIVLVFPTSIKLSNVVLDFYTMWDEKITSYCCDFRNDNSYTVKGRKIHILQTDMPLLFIDVNSTQLTKVRESYQELHNEETGFDYRTKKEKAKVEITTGGTGVKRQNMGGVLQPRGSATWNCYNKKPYTLKLAHKADLFGLGVDKKWNLLANASDKTLLKNETFFDLANSLDMENTPKTKNILLFFNNSLEGVYSITTKVQEGENRVQLNPGDYLINWGAPNYTTKVEYDCDFWVPAIEGQSPDKYVDIVYPDAELVTQRDKDKVHYIIQNFIDTVENDENADLSAIIDLDSFAKYYWIQEVAMNADGWYRSTYMVYKKSDGKLYAGPIWDMEWSMGSGLNHGSLFWNKPQGWYYRTNSFYPYLFKNQQFVDAVNRVYKECNLEKLLYENYETFVKKAKKQQIEGDLNFRIDTEEPFYFEVEGMEEIKTYDEWIQAKADFYKQRIDWIVNEMKTNGLQ